MRIRKDWIVAITLLDHAKGGRKLFEFVVYGRVSRVTRKRVVLAVWDFADGRLKHHCPTNQDTYVIVRKAIKQVRRLKEVKL